MNLEEITQASIAYSDRKDEATANVIPTFIKMVEAKINRELKVSSSTSRSTTTTIAEQKHYRLPTGFGGVREVSIRKDKSSKRILSYISNNIKGTKYNYTIINNELRLAIAEDYGSLLEIVYYKAIAPLTETQDSNWISREHPDVYIFGIMLEIVSFTKDVTAIQIWKNRFDESMASVLSDDWTKKWSGITKTTAIIR